jgi:hypothetical protein
MAFLFSRVSDFPLLSEKRDQDESLGEEENIVCGTSLVEQIVL